MGYSVDLYGFNRNNLKQNILDKCKIEPNEQNCKMLDFILDSFGSTIGDTYILLNNEFWEEYDCYYNISIVIDKVFNVEHSFGCFLNNETRENLISGVLEYDVLEEIEEKFGIKVEYDD